MKTLRQSKRRLGEAGDPDILTPTGSAWHDNANYQINKQGSITLREQDSDHT